MCNGHGQKDPVLPWKILDLFKDGGAWLDALENEDDKDIIPVIIYTNRNYHFLCLIKNGDYISPYEGPTADLFFDGLNDCITQDVDNQLHFGDHIINIDTFYNRNRNEADLTKLFVPGQQFLPESVYVTTAYGRGGMDIQLLFADCTENRFCLYVSICGSLRAWGWGPISSE